MASLLALNIPAFDNGQAFLPRFWEISAVSTVRSATGLAVGRWNRRATVRVLLLSKCQIAAIGEIYRKRPFTQMIPCTRCRIVDVPADGSVCCHCMANDIMAQAEQQAEHCRRQAEFEIQGLYEELTAIREGVKRDVEKRRECLRQEIDAIMREAHARQPRPRIVAPPVPVVRPR
jgi:hypothetical protein